MHPSEELHQVLLEALACKNVLVSNSTSPSRKAFRSKSAHAKYVCNSTEENIQHFKAGYAWVIHWHEKTLFV